MRSALGDLATVAWDYPGHGRGPAIEPPVDWRRFGEYVLEVTSPGGVGVGHSMGAAALAMAQIDDPRRFRALVLIEPIVFPGPYRREQTDALASAAERRRREFPSRDAAAESYRSKPAFARWVDAAFDGYIECGFIGDDEVHLACAPEVEAEIFRTWRDHDTWDRLGEIEVPVLLMSGGTSDTITPDFAREQAQRFQRAGLEIVADTGHFLPMERPELVAERVLRIVEAVSG